MIPIAIVANALTPYRLHFHQRVAREIPQIKLCSIFTHEVSNANWAFRPTEEINATLFGKGEATAQQAELGRAAHEWKKGGAIIDWLIRHEVRFVLVNGYNDLGRLRIFRWCHRHGVPVAIWSDSNIRGESATGIFAVAKKLLVGRVVNWCEAIMPCGSLGAEYFMKYGASRNQMYYVPVEPDYRLIQGLDTTLIAQVRERFALDPARRRIIYSGRLIREKRVDLLIDAFARIAAERPEWDLLIVGDGPLKAELQKHATPRTQWTGFIDDQATIAALYRLSDVLVLPSSFEPWALVINEAAAAGLAIVASDVVGAAVELVRDGVNGYIFRSGDLEDLTGKLRDVTAADRIDALKSGSAKVLQQWRDTADPIQGLRRALAACKVLAE
jgi:glycosyltransferase involved in cell wall biosynthesis